MTIARSAAEVASEHVALELECMDRLYVNAYVPILQSGAGTSYFFREIRGNPVPSSALMGPMTRSFVASIERFARDEGVEIERFSRGERKDERTRERLRRWDDREGVLYIGKAQERARVVRTERRQCPDTGGPYPWLVPSTAMVNQYYFYVFDDDFGPLFVKFCSYYPYNAKLCLNGHEYLKRQLSKRGIGFEALDNGILHCDDPDAMQAIAQEITASRIDALFRKWMARLPHPFTARDRAAGIRYDLSVLQAEFALTQVFDRPLHGRVFFEEVLRENLDLGRPDHVQLIFSRRINRRTPSRYRTRVITDGVIPSLHVDYKQSRIKQYYKESRALRTETVINNTYDFGIGRRLGNLEDLQKIGFAANRRLLRVQTLSHDTLLGSEAFQQLHQPEIIEQRRVPALRFGDLRVHAILACLLIFNLLPVGFANRQLREVAAPLLGLQTDEYKASRATYDLRRLRMRGLIERIPRTNRYRVTETGQRVALCYCRVHRRALGPALSAVLDQTMPTELGKIVERFDRQIHRLWRGQQMHA